MRTLLQAGMTRQANPGTDDVTVLLHAWMAGDPAALDRLIPLVHAELLRLAHRQLSRERSGQTLQPTALVNEAYLRLVDLRRMVWQGRAHFFAMSARLMRRILVDIALAKGCQKRGGGAQKVSFDEAIAVSADRGDDLVALDEALKAFAAIDPRRARIVELRFFAGLSVEETAEALHISTDTVMRDWKLAKVWLHRELSTPAATRRLS
jgi:RNA polymerase sigma factor (TIGR02999 family)